MGKSRPILKLLNAGVDIFSRVVVLLLVPAIKGLQTTFLAKQGNLILTYGVNDLNWTEKDGWLRELDENLESVERGWYLQTL